MLALMCDIHPDGFIFGGNQLDNAEISHHNRNKPLYQERGSISETLSASTATSFTPSRPSWASATRYGS
jgi:hypothetical protein